jgi:hypothetical protein
MTISWLRSSSERSSMALSCAIAILCAGTVSGQQSTARNVFWSASDLVQVSENPAAKSALGSDQPSAPRKKPAQPNVSHPKEHVDAVLVAKNGYGEQPQLVRVSNEQIGIRYALLLRDSTGHYSEVSPSTIFHNGDHLRLSVMANQPGYLYVIQQGSSGSWSSIFPRRENDHASAENVNEIEQGRVYQVPNGKSAFQFDRNPGQEKLFLVLSRERISDLDSTIKSLKDPAHPTQARPQQENSADPSQTLEAANQIPDAFVQSLASRDLSLVQEQEVDEPQNGDEAGEKAVYVVSKASYSKNESPQVVASVTLHHE